MSQEMPHKFTELDKLMLKGEPLPDDPLVLERLLQEENFDPSHPAFQKQIDARERILDAKAEEKKKSQRPRPESYMQRRNAILGARDSASIGLSLLFQVVFTIAGIVLLFASEFYATFVGASRFFHDEHLAQGILAATLIMLYFALEWRQAALQYEQGKAQKFKTTLADIFRRLQYFFSTDANIPRQAKEANHEVNVINSSRRVLIVLIVILGILGRLGPEIDLLKGSWYTAIADIFTKSTLPDFLNYIGGGAISAALLVATHFIMGYVYQSYVLAVGESEVGFFDEASFGREKEELRRQLFQHKLRQLWVTKEPEVRTVYMQLAAAKKQSQLPQGQMIMDQQTNQPIPMPMQLPNQEYPQGRETIDPMNDEKNLRHLIPPTPPR